MRTTPGQAFGTENCGNGPTDDSGAVLTGGWGPNQSATFKVHFNNTSSNEVEIRLNSTIGSHSNTGYEFNFSGGYAQIVRWNGALGNFDILANPTGSGPGVHEGDIVLATNVNGVLTSYINGVAVRTATDTTYRGGSPGIGAFCRGTFGNDSDMVITNFSATDGIGPWLSTGIIDQARATDWTQAGLPGDVLPSATWTQSGATIAACGSIGTPVSPATCGITAALAACGTNHYVLMAGTIASPADFYLNATVNVPSNCALRGGGANATRSHFANGGTYSCNGANGLVCLGTSNFFAGFCSATLWPCPHANWNNAASTANWTAGYSQGSNQITLDNVTGITVNLTPITLDQCDVGFVGTANPAECTGTVGGPGAITALTVNAGGTGYAVNDTFTISCSNNFGACYGASPTATGHVTSVSGGVVTGVAINSAGGGYTYTSNANGVPYVTTVHTSGSGNNGLRLSITGIVGYDNNSIFQCAITMVCTYLASSNSGRPARSEQEVWVATAITGSGPFIVTLNHPLVQPDWTSTRAPQAFWPSSGTVTNLGIENILIDGSTILNAGQCNANPGCAQPVVIDNAYKVWVSGIATKKANVLHVNATYAVNLLVANSYFYFTANGGTTSYGIGSDTAVSNALFENNILQGITDPVVFAGTCSACVSAYNFMVNQWNTSSSFLFASDPMHSSATNYILLEGNIGSNVQQDESHGPHFMDTYFRNYYNGFESNNGTIPNSGTVPIIVNAFSRYNNYLGNVLGTAGYHTVYECHPSSVSQQYCSTDAGISPGYVHIWDLGFSSIAQRDFTNTPVFTPNDPLTYTSLFRYGNYDTVNGAVQWNAAEVPTSDPNFPTAIPASHTLPPSFYLSSKPIFFGSSAWPTIGPDTTGGDIGMCTSGTYRWSRVLSSGQCAGGTFAGSVNGGFGASNPAMRAYLNGMSGNPDGTGAFLTNFNAQTFFGTGPAPPTGISGVVH